MSKGAGGLDDEQRRKLKEEQKAQQAVLENSASQDVVAPVQEEFVPPANDQVAATQLQQPNTQGITPPTVQQTPPPPQTPPQIQIEPFYQFAGGIPANGEERKVRYQGNLNKEISSKNGNVDFFSMSPVTGQQLIDAQWENIREDEPGSLWLLDIPSGKDGFNKSLTISAVDSNGIVWSPTQVNNYISHLHKYSKGDAKKALEYDSPKKGGAGLIAGVDLSEGEKKKIYELYYDYNAKPNPYLGTDYTVDSEDDSGIDDGTYIAGTLDEETINAYSDGEGVTDTPKAATPKTEPVKTTEPVKKTESKGNEDASADEGNRSFAFTDSTGNTHAIGMSFKDVNSKTRSKDLTDYYNSLVADSGGDYDKLLELDRERDNLIVGNNGAAQGKPAGTPVAKTSVSATAPPKTDSKPTTPKPTTTTTTTAKTETATPKENKAPAPKAGYSKRQQQARDDAAAEMSDKRLYNGNVDLLHRPVVDSKTMKKAGYDIPEGSTATVYSMEGGYSEKLPDGTSVVRELLYTPILPDGTVKTEEELDNYLNNLGEKGSIVELDKPENEGWGIVIASHDHYEDLGPHLHELQETYGMSPEDYAGMAKDAEKRLGSLGGNQNPVALKPVSRQAMVDKGWEFFSQYPDDEIYAYPVYWEITDDESKPHGVIFTPITKDGDVLDKEEFFDYIQSLNDNPNPLEADKKWGVILKYDAEPEDVDAIDKDIESWRMGRPDPTEEKPLTYRGDNYDEMVAFHKDDIAARQKDYDEKKGEYETFMKDPSKTTAGQLILSQQDETVREHNMTPEERKKMEKRQKTARLIANIGDILQGFANLAGTWYGARSSNLSSLSAATDERAHRENADWTKRYKELVKSSEKALDDMRNILAAEMKESFKELQKAKERYASFMSSVVAYRPIEGRAAQA